MNLTKIAQIPMKYLALKHTNNFPNKEVIPQPEQPLQSFLVDSEPWFLEQTSLDILMSVALDIQHTVLVSQPLGSTN